jgi:hypothetical protein
LKTTPQQNNTNKEESFDRTKQRKKNKKKDPRGMPEEQVAHHNHPASFLGHCISSSQIYIILYRSKKKYKN